MRGQKQSLLNQTRPEKLSKLLPSSKEDEINLQKKSKI